MKTRKSLAFILALVMMLTLIPASAFAATTNTLAAKQTVATEGSFTATINMKVADAAIPPNESQKFDIVLENAEFDVYGGPSIVTGTSIAACLTTTQHAIYMEPGAGTISTSAMGVGKSIATVEIASTTAIAVDATFAMQLRLVAGTSEGDVKVTINPSSNCKISGGTYVVATATSGTTAATVFGTVPSTGDRAKITTAAIKIEEVAAGVLGSGVNQGFKLVLLTKGFEFVSGQTDAASDLGPSQVGALSGTDSRTLTFGGFAVNAQVTKTRTLVVKDIVIKANADAKPGDVYVRLESLSTQKDKIATADLVIAKFIEDGVTVTTVAEKDLPVITAGRLYKDTSKTYDAKIKITEAAPNSLIRDRYVTFTLPKGVRIATDSAVGSVKYTVNGGSDKTGGIESTVIADPSAKDVSYFDWTIPTDGTVPANKANTVEFTIPLTVAADFTGDVKINVAGAKAGVTSTDVVVAKAQAPITVEIVLKDVRTGVKKQAIGDIIIKEAYAGALMDTVNYNEVNLAIEDMAFGSGKASVTKGDLELVEKETDSIVKTVAGALNTLEFKVKHSSFKTPSEVTIKDVQVTLDRTPAEGKYNLNVGGKALVRNGKGVTAVATYTQKYSEAKFSNNVVSVPYVNVATPAEQGVNSAFVIGNKTYTVNGVTKEMDAAPYIDAASRTMVPIRYIGYALGLTDYQVLWNPATSTATLFGKSTVVITVGKDTLSVNGAIVPMDTKAVNKDGRIYVPARYIGNALGAQVEWDQASSTVAIYTVK